MSNSDRRLLRITIDEGTGKTLCRVVDDSTEASASHDCGPMVANLWSNYSREVTARFERTFSPEALAGCEVPSEVIEHHLLVELYRPHAFPRLLAERLAAAFADGFSDHPANPAPPLREALLALPPTAGDPRRLAALVEMQLQGRPADAGRIRGFSSGIKAAAGLAIGAATACLGVVRLEFLQKADLRKRSLPCGSLYMVFSGEGAHTRHIWGAIDQIPAGAPPPMVLMLGLTPLEMRLRMRIEERGGRVIHLMSVRDLGAAFAAMGRCSRELLRLHRRGERDLGMDVGTSFHVRTGAWFLRGLMHDRFLRGVPMKSPEHTVAVFGLVAHADSRLADFALRQRGAQTLHWLHGIVEDGLHYRANSSVCLCQNEVDAELRQRHGAYGSCRVYPGASSEMPTEENVHTTRETGSGGLVITNLIHPDNRFADYGAAVTLAELLRMTADCFRKMGIPTFTWRPHPKESTAADFERFKQLAIDLGFRVDNSTHLRDQVKSHCQVISTFSGSIGDVADAGALPAIFAGLPYETEGHWGRLPEALKFRSAAELAAVLARLTDGEWATAQRRALLRQYNQPRTRPANASLLLDELHPAIPRSRSPEEEREYDPSTASGHLTTRESLQIADATLEGVHHVPIPPRDYIFSLGRSDGDDHVRCL